MTDLIAIIYLIIRNERQALARGFALAFVVLVMGVALLALSGWFILATAAAGMAGIGILFNVFAPSAMVRFLALGRTAARYGERILTHDATLRAVSELRVSLLRGLLTRPYRALERLRANSELNRITADTDALDGALLRLVIPALAGSAAILITSLVLWWIVHPSVAAILAAGYLVLPTGVFCIGQGVAKSPARLAEAALQAGRSRMVDLLSGRDDLTVFGQLPRARDHTIHAFDKAAQSRRRLDQIERQTGMLMDMVTALVTSGCLMVGITLVQADVIETAQAAIGVFAALALGEAVAPVRRALSEIGKMTKAAARVRPALKAPDLAWDDPKPPLSGQGLEMYNTTFATQGKAMFKPISLSVAPGETVVLEGASGSGKSTVLLLAIGALVPAQGIVRALGCDPAQVSMDAMTRKAVLVTQRSALIAGTISDNLRLADPTASDAALWRALETVCLHKVLQNRGGLDLKLGPRGSGLSGGEARRLILARAILRRPDLLLLDEPTEGLDDATADLVMTGLRDALPNAAFLVAAHRQAERAQADGIVPVIRA
ncbi:ATP-binding cassette domain-containing protein [Epibacterium sp. SM1979]|uniref:ATP-binding cassette domain-containing protein n=1 Tax=Tritonibacter litoralis TaxID=2662264 RepID=A0A843YD48_9RHOB|nr:ATP-binding cassette domain-containing protein [Tritonibacter litoralis]MQQ07788.1 ATP-binding cassette domain-containing protein [Tritonibacter litoralis]